MARYPKMTAVCHIDGKVICTIDEEKNVSWIMGEEELKKYRQKMLDNIGKQMSGYLQVHPDSAFFDN